ncbi:MAG: LPS-assembly protein LptD [Deltaproteobacteria bacterium]|nr:LPS-assembly protein LptD [Deltaproteobacteria bacterium]
MYHLKCRTSQHGWYNSSARMPPVLGVLIRRGCILCLMLLFYGTVWGQNLDSVLGDTQIPWHITADEISFDETLQVYIATGNVVISKMDTQITADTIHFDHKKMEALAEGHVIMSVDHLETEKGTLHNGSVFLHQENFHINGNKIVKTGKDSYHVDEASLTTCDGEKPAWKITGRNLNVTIEGYGYANHAVFWVKNIPVFYTPFIAFPVKSKRQTGLLPPQIGTSSRKGFEYHQPLFWAINDSVDATFYDHYMKTRGNKLGAEFRYVTSPLTKGSLMMDYLDDNKVDNNADNNHDWGYDDDPDEDVLRSNRNRYWFRMKHNQVLPWRFSAMADLDIVSDQDYLKEFKSGYTGYNDTKDYYNDEFNRDIDDYNDPIRLNRLNINRNWSSFSLDAEFRWYDNVISRQEEDRDTTVQRLPFIQFNAPKQQLGSSLFYGAMGNEYTYFYRENTDTANRVTRDHRFDVYPKIYLPLSWKNYFILEPSMGFRGTYWQVVDHEDSDGDTDNDKTFHRELMDYQLDLSTEVYNILHTGGDRIDRYKHSVSPRIVYTYIPEEDQSTYPDFDAKDRIGRQNRLTYSLTNLLTYRSMIKKKISVEEETSDPEYHYQRFLRLYLEQSYHLHEADENNPSEWENKETRKSFSPVFGRVELTPGKYITIEADAEWSTYENALISRNLSTTLWDSRGDRLSVEYRYKQKIPDIDQVGLKSAYAKLSITMTEALSATAEYEKDLYEDNHLLTSIGALYKAQCWSFQLTYTREEEDDRYDFMIGFHGLGKIQSDFFVQ